MKAYLITLATGIALGSGAVQLADLNEVNAEPYSMQKVVSAQVPAGQVAAVETFLANLLCTQIEEDFGVTTCPASAIRRRGVTFKWDDDDQSIINVLTNIKVDGSWAPAVPE